MAQCVTCHKEAGEAREITTEYQGAKVTLFKSGIQCEDCRRKEWERDFQKLGVLVSISPDVGCVKVYWNAYREYTWGYPSQENVINKCLVSLGIFSSQSAGNWDVVSDGHIGLNPTVSGTYLYFTRKVDAVSFAVAEYRNSIYNWEVRLVGRTDEVILKQRAIEEVLKLELGPVLAKLTK